VKLTGEFVLTVVEGGLSPDSPAAPETNREDAIESAEAWGIPQWRMLACCARLEAFLGRPIDPFEIEMLANRIHEAYRQVSEIEQMIAGHAFVVPVDLSGGQYRFIGGDSEEAMTLEESADWSEEVRVEFNALRQKRMPRAITG
jgi:hypothetical protein